MKASILSKIAFLAAIPSFTLFPSANAQQLAQPTPTNPESPHPLVLAIAESENLSIEETLDLLDKQYNSRETLRKAENIAGTHYAGGWISEDESPAIAVNSPITKQIIEQQFSDDGIKVKLVQYDYSDLDQAFNQASKLVSEQSDVDGSSVVLNEEENTVDVFLPTPESSLALESHPVNGSNSATYAQRLTAEQTIIENASDRFQELSNQLIASHGNRRPIITVHHNQLPKELVETQGCNSRSDCFPYLRGGLRIERYVGNKALGCTAGFNARSGNQHYLITAGHCGDVGHHIYQNSSRFLGVIDRSINNSHDSARIKVLGPWRSTSWLWANHGWQSLTIVGKAARNSPRRSVACFSGVTHGYRCGRIVNTRTSYDRWTNVWEADFQGEKGDSGGPVILPGNSFKPTNIEAYGIVNAKDALNPFANYHTFGHHINDVEQRLGVSIVTRR